MGSLLPGWDSTPFQPPQGIGAELHNEKMSAEKHGGWLNLQQTSSGFPQGHNEREPLLSRKSAPSALVIKKLHKVFADEHSPTLEARILYSGMTHLTPQEEDEDEEEEGEVYALYSRDKWWRKFSSAHLNELAKEYEKEQGKSTYVPQFGLAGGNHYIHKKATA